MFKFIKTIIWGIIGNCDLINNWSLNKGVGINTMDQFESVTMFIGFDQDYRITKKIKQYENMTSNNFYVGLCFKICWFM